MKFSFIKPVITQENKAQVIKDMMVFTGQQAGICYMKDDYFAIGAQDREKAICRAETVTDSGHHSVADHIHLTALLDGIPKALAMYLNARQTYTTSEKSARYREMKPATETETRLYHKWTGIMENFISTELSQYVGLKGFDPHKLAIENARYFISVFTPTVMSYTTSLRDWHCLIIELTQLHSVLSHTKDDDFARRLLTPILDLGQQIRALISVPQLLAPSKNYGPKFFADYNHKLSPLAVQRPTATCYASVYVCTYKVSWAALGELERHRNIAYLMSFADNRDCSEFYTPRAFLKTGRGDLASEWAADMALVASEFPQGQLLTVTERGTVEAFCQKCSDRLCGRVQFEVFSHMVAHTKSYYDYCTDAAAKGYLCDTLALGETGIAMVKPRCEFGQCLEGCYYGKNTMTRII